MLPEKNGFSFFAENLFTFEGNPLFFLTFWFFCNFFSVIFVTFEGISPFDFLFLLLNCFLLVISLKTNCQSNSGGGDSMDKEKSALILPVVLKYIAGIEGSCQQKDFDKNMTS